MVAQAKKFWAEILMVAGWAWVNFGPSTIAYVQAHPAVAVKVASTIGAITIAAARLSTSPLAKPPATPAA